MKTDLLVAGILQDEEFRVLTLRQTLTLARRRRRVRVAQRLLAICLLLGAVAFLFRPSAPVPLQTATVKTPAVVLVRTANLATGQVVKTQLARFTRVSTTSTSIARVPTGRSPLIVQTRTAAPNVDVLSDQQLLAVSPNGRYAIVAPSTPEAQLFFY